MLDGLGIDVCQYVMDETRETIGIALSHVEAEYHLISADHRYSNSTLYTIAVTVLMLSLWLSSYWKWEWALPWDVYLVLYKSI